MLNKYMNMVSIVIIVTTSCQNDNSRKMVDINSITKIQWDTLATKRIYFGHQSVGFNIMDGVKAHLENLDGVRLNVLENDNPSIYDSPFLLHMQNGQNHDPISKIDAFAEKLEGGMGDKLDVACFKFCYVDFKETTNVTEVFEYYTQRIDRLISQYPGVEIIHVTVPLRTTQKGLKRIAYLILGREIGIEHNLAREEFNNLIRNRYRTGPIFDLAQIESTYSNGKREFDMLEEKEAYSLISEYSSDGGHLSEEGKLVIGGEFLQFLANL
jgi:hypothetical protein